MDILKIFKLADNDITINIRGTPDDPLFQANQIGELLGINNIRQNIRDFDESERDVCLTYTPGGDKNITFLTEKGLYKILFRSRKPIANKFQNWVYDVIKEIRTTGKYELRNTIEIERQLNEKCVELERHKTLISSNENKRALYLTKLKEIIIDGIIKYIIKLGWTNEIGNRNRALTTQFGGSTFQDIFECTQNQQFELFCLLWL